jgi:hypothetical protein
MRILALLVVAAATWCALPAPAAEADPLVVTLDKPYVMRLVKPARRVIVGNPAIADVTLESPTLIYVFGKTPGETGLIVLGEGDRTVLSRPVVVTTNAERTVSVHLPGTDGPTGRDYSCLPDRCLRIASPEIGPKGSTGPMPAVAPAPAVPTSAIPDVTQPAPAGTLPPLH